MKRKAMVLLCLIGLLVLFGCGKKQEPVEIVQPLPAETVSSLLYNNGTTTLRFTNSEDKWIWADGEDFPLDDSTVREIVAQLPDILAAAPQSGTADLAACGLAEPTRYLTAGSEEGSQTVYFGTQTTSGDWYMRGADSDKIYLAPDSFVQLLERDIYDMAILPTLPELTEDIVTFIGVSRGEENNTYLLHAEEAWKSNGKNVAATAEAILKELDGMSLSRCVDYFPAAGVSELCGLTESATTITIKYMNSVGSESELILTVGTLMESGESYYLTVGESDAIYCMPRDQLNTLLSLLE